MRLNKLYTPLIIVVLSGGCAVAGEATHSVTVRDAGNTYQLKENAFDGSLVLIDNKGENQIGQCGEKSVEKVVHPASGFTALVYIRDCGATTDFATHVAIAKSTDTPKAIAVFAGKPKIAVRWIEQGLEIVHSTWPPELILKQDTQALGLNIVYKAGADAASPTDPKLLEFSSFNFGATGRAAGLPAEVLLRWAGWCQMASGLYKLEFGSWSGDVPYGDDPTGSAAILDGIRYYETRFKKHD